MRPDQRAAARTSVDLHPAKRLAFALIVGVAISFPSAWGFRAWRQAKLATALRPSFGVVAPRPAPPREPPRAPSQPSVPEPPPPPAHRTVGAQCDWLTEKAGTVYPFDLCLAREYRREDVEIHDGIWGPRIPAVKDANEVRVGCFGGSVVEGYVEGPPNQVAWPSMLERHLNETERHGKHYRVINFGIAGMASTAARWRFENETRDLGLDVAIVYAAENDVQQCDLFPHETGDQLEKFLFDGDRTELAQLSPWFRQNADYFDRMRARREQELADWVARADPAPPPWTGDLQAYRDVAGSMLEEQRRTLYQKPHLPVDPALVAVSPFASEPLALVDQMNLAINVRAIVATAKARGIGVVVTIPPLETTCHGGFAPFVCAQYPVEVQDLVALSVETLPRWFRALAAESHVPLVDGLTLTTTGDDRCQNFVDGVHLTESGLDRVARAFVPAVRAALERRHGRSGASKPSRSG